MGICRPKQSRLAIPVLRAGYRTKGSRASQQIARPVGKIWYYRERLDSSAGMLAEPRNFKAETAVPSVIADYVEGTLLRLQNGFRALETEKPTYKGGLFHIDITSMRA
ncbi:PA0977 ortholog, hypothetical protein [Pseudomonas aeruginosa PAK]|nr:PA0977 ortholog, hypothetical protein [Pseudomonas aeruginosa PAK]